jgi:hypothetical protein
MNLRSGHLTVLAGGADDTVDAGALIPALQSRPFRPGELPTFVALDLGSAAESAHVAARRQGVPVELFARLIIEAVRHLRALEGLLGHTTSLSDALDMAAGAAPTTVEVVEGRELRAYAAALLRGGAAGRVTSATTGSTVEVSVTQEMATAWAAAAAGEGRTVSGWAAAHIVAAPAGAVAWEAAAARAGRTLGEWIYEEAAARLASSRAAPQR